jgi:hypothetical protein
MFEFDDPAAKIWEAPPEYLLSPGEIVEALPPEQAPHRALSPVPDVQEHLEQIEKNAAAKMTEQIGNALRAGLGIGALALLPDLIEDLRRAKDPDTRIKFLQLAFKEGGYGVKDDSKANLPVFHFNFVGVGGTATIVQETQAASSVPAIEDATYTVRQDEVEQAPAGYWGVAADDINRDVDQNTPVAELSVFQLIEGI